MRYHNSCFHLRSSNAVSRRLWLMIGVLLAGIPSVIHGAVPLSDNHPPRASAGADRSAVVSETVTLDGSDSVDTDGNRLSFVWRFVARPPGSAARLSDPAAVNPAFTVDMLGDYVVELTVNDGEATSSADQVRVTTSNSKPVARVAPAKTLQVGRLFRPDGSASVDDDGDVIAYAWTLTKRPHGSQAELSGDNSARPALVPDAEGEYILQLVVSDGTLASEPASIRLSTGHSPPVANAGLRRAERVARSILLDGTGSHDPDGETLRFDWALLHTPMASQAELQNPASSQPTLRLDQPGLYLIQLIVDDGQQRSDPDTLVVLAHIGGGGGRSAPEGVAPDTDGDGVFDINDNCLLDANPDQRDTNNDGLGNVCDADIDNNDAVNFTDLGLMKAVFFTMDPDADFNGDGAVNFTDLGIMKSKFFQKPGPIITHIWNNELGGDWDNPDNWLPAEVPGPSDGALIDVDADILVTHSTGTHEIQAIISNNDFEISGGTMNVTSVLRVIADLTLSGGTLENADVYPDATATVPEASNFALDGVTLQADLLIENNADVTLRNGLILGNSTVTLASAGGFTDLEFSGDQTLGGSGEIVFGGSTLSDTVNRAFSVSANDLTIGAGITVRSDITGGQIGLDSAGRNLFIEGVIRSETAGRTITVAGQQLSNENMILGTGGGNVTLVGSWINAADGTISVSGGGDLSLGNVSLPGTNEGQIIIVDGGSLTLDGDWSNPGVIDVTNTRVVLDGEFELADVGALNTTGPVDLSGTLQNAATTLDLDTVPGDWQMINGGRINDGTVTGSAPLIIVEVANVTLDGVTLEADTRVENNADVTIRNGLTLSNSVLSLLSGGNFTDLEFQGTQTLDGTGEVRFAGTTTSSGVNRLFVNSADVLTLGPGITVRTETTGGQVGLNSTSRALINRGRIISDIDGKVVTVAGQPVTNEGLLQASNGGQINLLGMPTNAVNGVIELNDGTFTIDGEWANLGVIDATNATITLEGTFMLADIGTINTTGLVPVILAGTLENASTTVNLDLLPGEFELGTGGRINGGTITGSMPLLAPAGIRFTLDGVTLDTDFDVENNANITVLNGLTLAGSTVTLLSTGNFTDLEFSGTQSLSGSGGEVVFSGTTGSDSTNRVFMNNAGDLTIESGITVRTGTVGGQIGLNSVNRGVINQGQIVSNLPGHTVFVLGQQVTNESGITGSTGGSIDVQGAWVNEPGGTLQVTGGGSLRIGSGALEGANAGQITVVDSSSLTLDGAWTNTGVIDVTNTEVTLDGQFALSDVGLFNTVGTVILMGELENTATTLDLDTVPGAWRLGTGGQITGGTVAGSVTLVAPEAINFTLDGVTMSADFDIENNADITVRNNLTLSNNVIRLLSSGNFTDLEFTGSQTLDGFGEVRFAGTAASDTVNRIFMNNGGDLTIGPIVTIRTETTGGQIGLNSAGRGLINRGTIISDIGGKSVTILGQLLTNESQIQASGGGDILLNGIPTNAASGNIDIANGTLTLNGEWSNLGNINATDATIELEGTFALADVGTVNVTGTVPMILLGVLDSTGDTLDLDTFPGELELGNTGQITGGTVTGSVPLEAPEAINFTLDDVSLSTDFNVRDSADISVRNGLTLVGSTMTLFSDGSFTDIEFSGTQTLGGTGGSVVFNGTAISDTTNRLFMISSSGDLTIGAGITIRTGTAGGQVGIDAANRPLIIQGTVIADTVGRVVNLAGRPVTNQGTLTIGAGGAVDLDSDFVQSAAGEIGIEIAGILATEHGRITSVSGRDVTLDGTLDIVLDSFSPSHGQTFEVITAGTRSGTFATENGTDIGGGLAFDVNYNPSDVTLEVVNAR